MSIPNKIKAWFDPPVFAGDEEQTMLVNLLNANMIFINAYLLLVILSYWLGVKMAVGAAAFDGIMFFAILIFRHWLFKGWIKAAAIGLLVAGFIMITLVTISMGTVTAPATDTYILIVIMAGVFFRQRGVLLSTVATSLAVLGLILAEKNSMLPDALELEVVPQWLTYTIVFLVAGSLIHYAMQTMRRALDSLKQENQERKQTEEQLRESNERFHQIANNIQETFWMWDLQQNKLIYISPAYRRLWGVSEQALYQNPSSFVDAIVPEDQAIMVGALERQAAAIPTEIQYRIQAPDGRIHWVWDRSFPVFNGQGKLVRKAGIITDITDVKNAEAELAKLNHELEKRVEDRTTELRQSEETYRALFENSNDGIFLLTPAGFEIKANQRALDMVGYTWEEYHEANLQTKNVVAAPGEQTDAEDKIAAVARGESIPLYERTFITRDGSKRNVEINLSAIRNTAGEVVMVQSVVRDITSRKKNEEALRQSRDQLSAANLALEKASRLKDEFLASMSHELRTPLTGILGIAEGLQMQIYGPLNEKQIRALKNIENSGHHLLELINDILDLSKIAADKLDLKFEICRINDICNSSLQLTRGMANQKRQRVLFSSTLENAVVRADPRRLKQMLVNLLSNAIKFTAEDGTLGLDVDASDTEHLLRLTVWDKGIGIKPEDISRLFKPFTQLDASLARQYSGTGLGLSLVDRLAKMHGGSVSVESIPGEGSRFTITLPWSGDAVIEARRGAPKPGTEKPVQPEKRVRGTILLADDDPMIVTTFSDFLQVNAYQVVAATNGLELVQLAPACQPDVIMVDIQMPGMDGLEAIRQIRAMEDPRMQQVPIIAVTALAMPHDEEKCLQAGANRYLSKPVRLTKLIETLKALM